MNVAAEAGERAVMVAHVQAAVVRALAMWETWIVLVSVAYLAIRFAPWAAHGFTVVGR